MDKRYELQTSINRHVRNPEKFEVLDLFDAIGRDKNYVLGDEKNEKAFVDIISKALAVNKTPTMIYGRRTEAMFAYMIASLGKCGLIKKEDSGDLFANDDTIKVPDYRVVLNSGEQILVEVKNYHQKEAFDQYCINTDYLNGLSKYADLMKIDLRIAIYWSKWCLWTLVYPNDFICDGVKSVISINNATKRNTMSDFGDVLIGTTPPLTIRIYSDKQQPHFITDNNNSKFTIGDIEMLCNNNTITIEGEKRIAFALMLFGDWEESNIITHTANKENEIDYIEFSYSPQQYDSQQGFCIINSLSTIISRQYGQLTAPQGKVQRLTPNIEPGMLGFVIPEDYKGKALPLWRFLLNPNYK